MLGIEFTHYLMARAHHSEGLAAYWGNIHDSLQARLDVVRDYLRHPISGTNAEGLFRDVLRAYPPQRSGVESGLVVNTHGTRSDLHDLLIVDTLNIPPLSAESHFKVFLAEAVVAGIEITSAPKSAVRRSGVAGTPPKLEDDILKLARLREIARDREYIVTAAVPAAGDGVGFKDARLRYELSPRAYLLTCGDEWKRPRSYEDKLMSALTSAARRHEHVWLNGALSLRHGLFRFKPHTKFMHDRVSENALLEFVLSLNNAIASVPTGRIDLSRYRPNLPKENERSKA
jgi:hypothetical protein